MSLVASISTIKSWITRFQNEYLKSQTFFTPYPDELMTIDAVTEACESERDELQKLNDKKGEYADDIYFEGVCMR